MHSILKVALTILIAKRKCTQFSSLHSFLSFAPTSRTRTRTHISNLLHFKKRHSFLKLALISQTLTFQLLIQMPSHFFYSLLHSFLKLALTSQSRFFFNYLFKCTQFSRSLLFRVEWRGSSEARTESRNECIKWPSCVSLLIKPCTSCAYSMRALIRFLVAKSCTFYFQI